VPLRRSVKIRVRDLFSTPSRDEITTLFRYNDAVLRNLVIKRKDAVSDMSEIMKAENESRERKARASARMAAEESYDRDSDDDDDNDEADASEEAESAS